jgi:hypothetical protein
MFIISTKENVYDLIMVYVTIVIAYFIFFSSNPVQSFRTTDQAARITVQQRPTTRNALQLKRRTTIEHTHNKNSGSTVLYTTGGWGIGPQRELTPEEFATGGQLQNKKYFEGYQIRNRGEFMRQVAMDKEEMIRGELDELLGVAASAGLKVKNPKERLNKFDPSIIIDDEDDETLDVSVQWEDDVNNNMNQSDNVGMVATSQVDESVSITRLDEDTGSLGVW